LPYEIILDRFDQYDKMATSGEEILHAADPMVRRKDFLSWGAGL
jgi:hypothetical protein